MSTWRQYVIRVQGCNNFSTHSLNCWPVFKNAFYETNKPTHKIIIIILPPEWSSLRKFSSYHNYLKEATLQTWSKIIPETFFTEWLSGPPDSYVHGTKVSFKYQPALHYTCVWARPVACMNASSRANCIKRTAYLQNHSYFAVIRLQKLNTSRTAILIPWQKFTKHCLLRNPKSQCVNTSSPFDPLLAWLNLNHNQTPHFFQLRFIITHHQRVDPPDGTLYPNVKLKRDKSLFFSSTP
jgi:hypothetical protein